jgi:hypothetical protein
MVSITDAGPLIRNVNVGGKDIVVSGISFSDLVPMLDRFPELRRMLTPARGEISTDDFSFEGILKLGPRIIGAAITAGIGESGNAEVEKWAMKLAIGYQVEIMRAVIDLTFPKGVRSLVEDLRAMGLLGGAEEEGEETGKPNGSGATGKDQATSSLSASESSSDTATRTL